MWSSLITTPRPVPGRLLPAAGAAVVLALALAVFLVAGWSIAAWALGAILWSGVLVLGLMLGRVRSTTRNVFAASGVMGFELMLKALVVLGVLVAVAASRPGIALGTIVVFALAYTVERGLSLASYFGAEPR